MKTPDGKTILELDAHQIELIGDSKDLLWKVTASREKRDGSWERYELRLKCCRWSVQRIARQIATMHERDRARLREELRRIELEAEAIKQPYTQS